MFRKHSNALNRYKLEPGIIVAYTINHVLISINDKFRLSAKKDFDTLALLGRKNATYFRASFLKTRRTETILGSLNASPG
jgi:DNA-directed RNA polymerase subunit L